MAMAVTDAKATPRRRRPTMMTDVEILAGLTEILEEFVGVEPSDVTPEASLMDDLTVDSLSMVEIIVSAQDRFGVEIPDKDLKYLRTVQDVISYVQHARVTV
jgi:acyl carrier protein